MNVRIAPIPLTLLAFLTIACAPIPIPTATIPAATPSRAILPTLAATNIATVVPTTLFPTTTRPLLPTVTPSIVSVISSPVAFERNPRAVLIEADVSGGLTRIPVESHVPTFRLYGDGLVVFAGERAPISTGLDATVLVGRLSESEIQNLLGYLNQSGFYSLREFYQPRPTPTDMPTARISVYTSRLKTVRVNAPGSDGTPQIFTDALERIKQAIPADAQVYVPADGYLQTTLAGSVNELSSGTILGDWSNAVIRLSDAVEGSSVSGTIYSQVLALYVKNFPNTLFREGERAYRVRFSPNLPRAVHLTDWLGVILDAPREFDGRVFEIVGYFRGANLYGEARGNPPAGKNDWVISDDAAAMFVNGVAPPGLNLNSRADAWSVVRLRASVVYVRLGTSYLEARRVENLSSEKSSSASPAPTRAASSTPAPVASATFSPVADKDAAIAAVKARFPEVANIKISPPGIIGASTNITVFDRGDGWDLVFWEGSGDCPAGCINNHYHYFTVKREGRITKVGEYARVFNSASNSFDTTGAPQWGVPR